MLSRTNTLASSANIRQAIAVKSSRTLNVDNKHLNLLEFNPKKYVTKDLKVLIIIANKQESDIMSIKQVFDFYDSE
jgi:hypothetical protein